MSNLHIFCYTFNQNGSYICPNVITHVYEMMKYSMTTGDTTNTKHLPDIVCLGFQETRYGFEYYWDDLPFKNHYRMIHKIRLNGVGNVGIRGLGLYVLALRNLPSRGVEVSFESDKWVRYNYQYFGKGVISTLVTVRHLSTNVKLHILFINTHMPYSDDWAYGGIKERADSLEVMYEYIIRQTAYEYIFILGDFNFRTQLRIANVDKQESHLFLKYKQWEFFQGCDEFHLMCRKSYRLTDESNASTYKLEDIVIPSFYKSLLDTFQFQPTYKLQRDRKVSVKHLYPVVKKPSAGLEELDMSQYTRWDTDRIPSWCDRILYMPSQRINRVIYGTDNSPLIANSDHLPVFSLFLADFFTEFD